MTVSLHYVKAPEPVEAEPFDTDRIVAPSVSYETVTVPTTSEEVPQSAILSDICEPEHRLAVKTNMLYDAALLPNIEVEWRINRNWSVSLEGDLAWWGNKSKEKSYRLAIVEPEVRRWIKPRAPWHSFYIGLFAGAGLYDLENGGKGYRGEGAFGGISVGYMWPISRCLSLEAEIGGGYLYTRCKEYKPFEGHHVYQRTKDINYFGPLKVNFSLVWRLWDLNKCGSHKAQKQKGDMYEK